MRILTVTSYYPPSRRGWGYMQLCEEVTDGLAARGHEVAVLTSTQCDGREESRPYGVYRLLAIEPNWRGSRSAAWQFFVGRRRRERRALSDLRMMLRMHRPQVILVWDAVGLPRVLLQSAEQQRECVTAYYLAGYLPELPDEYLAYWRSQPVRPLAKVLKRPLAAWAKHRLLREGKPIRLKYPHVMCVSRYVRERLVSQGLIPAESVVIYNGVEVSLFSRQDHVSSDVLSTPLRCLVAGRVTAGKGIHTAIDALGFLANRVDTRLTILGDGPSEYADLLRCRVHSHGLQDVVRFESPIPRSRMPSELAQHDVLILPSENAEAIPRVMQEAMAMGLLVIGTTTGGSGELLCHEQTGLVFEAGNAVSLAKQLARARADPKLVARLVRAARERVRSEFRIDQTVSKIESYLERQVSQYLCIA